jgi:lysozyme
MTIFGVDVSHHQPVLNWAQMRREGIEYAIIKATEGSAFKDPDFGVHTAGASGAGMLVAAYHYVKSNATAAAQVANIIEVVPRDMPIMLDIERNSGGADLARDLYNRLTAAGYHVPMTYLPRWYWVEIGAPSLVGLPPLWSSRYPDTVAGTVAGEYADVPATYWNGYGGLPVAMLQFTSSARAGGYQPLDANAFPGTREQLVALWGGQENDMQLTDNIINPATGQPALDTNGKPYTVSQVLYYASITMWQQLEKLDTLLARPVADLDEDLLAEKLAEQGITGATPAQVKDAVKAALREGTAAPETP